MNIYSELSCCLIGFAIMLSLWFGPPPLIAPAHHMLEVCENGIDDDGDGNIDAFDPDCQCNGRLTPNLVPNGSFSETTGCCADLGQVNCLADWVVLGPSPDYISSDCIDNNLRPDVRFLTNVLNQGSANDDYIFGIVQIVDGRQFTESMGVCLESPMEAGKVYEVSFQLANLRNDAPDLQFSLMGIDRCDRLGAYDTRGNNSFCELQLPATSLATINARDLVEGWNTFTFELSPTENIEAILYTASCGFTPSTNDALLYMVMDEVSIREIVEPLSIPDIVTSGQACQEALSLTVEYQAGSSYQWYRDSIPIPGAKDTLLLLGNGMTSAPGIYQVLISDADGNCDLTAPFVWMPTVIRTQVNETICEGMAYEFGGRWIDETGVYLDTLLSIWACDSIVELQLEVRNNSIQLLTESICAGESYFFAGEQRSIEGRYQDTLVNEFGCDSILQLDLTIRQSIQSELSVQICAGEAYAFAGQDLNLAGIYRDTLQGTEGCDSIVTLNLSILEAPVGDTLFVEQPIGTHYDFMGMTYSTTGIYQATLTSLSGCDSTAFLSLSFYDPCTRPLIVSAVSLAASCEVAANGQIEILVEGEFPPYAYGLNNQPLQGDSIITGLDPGHYMVVVEDTFGCIQSTPVEVSSLNNLLQVDLGPDTSIFLGEQIDLQAIAINFSPVALMWSSVEELNCLHCPILSISPSQSTRYYFEVTDEFGCQTSDEIWVEVIHPPSFYVPNAFSPNDDGINDVFRAEGTIDALDRIEGMKIYSRWGDLLVETEGGKDGHICSWDGLVKGQQAEVGVYVYAIQWRNFKGELELLTGDVLLVR